MLHVALELDRRVSRGVPYRVAIAQLRIALCPEEQVMVDALESCILLQDNFAVRSASLRELRPGMILHQDVLTTKGLFILSKGTVLTDTWIERVNNFARAHAVEEPIRVRVKVPIEESPISSPPSCETVQEMTTTVK